MSDAFQVYLVIGDAWNIDALAARPRLELSPIGSVPLNGPFALGVSCQVVERVGRCLE